MAREPEDVVEQRRVLGKRLSAFRRAAELTQDDLAQAVFHDRTYVSHAENGRTPNDEQFWLAADGACHANGALLAGYQEIVRAKEEHEWRLREESLAAARERVAHLGVGTSRLAVVTAMPLPLGSAEVPDADVLGFLDRTRRLVDETLSRGTVSRGRMELIQERVADHVLSYTRCAPLSALEVLTPDVLEVQSVAVQRQPAVVQARLSEAAAVLALLCADALMKLGQVERARYWYGTARQAADDTLNLELRARVRAQEAMWPYYYGRVEQTVTLARAAQAIVQTRPCDAAALAAAAEARALARLGMRDGAEQALARAERLADQLDGNRDGQAFVFTENRLRLYQSGTLTYLGETARARRVQDQALRHYGDQPSVVIDPVLIQLDRAICEVRDGDPDTGCQVAVNALTGMPAEHRTDILFARALDVVHAIPLQARTRPGAVELRELMAENGSA